MFKRKRSLRKKIKRSRNMSRSMNMRPKLRSKGLSLNKSKS